MDRHDRGIGTGDGRLAVKHDADVKLTTETTLRDSMTYAYADIWIDTPCTYLRVEPSVAVGRDDMTREVDGRAVLLLHSAIDDPCHSCHLVGH